MLEDVVDAASADVGDLRRQRTRELMLDAEVPLHHVVRRRILLDVIDTLRIEIQGASLKTSPSASPLD